METVVGVAIGLCFAIVVSLLIVAIFVVSGLRRDVETNNSYLKDLVSGISRQQNESEKLREALHPFLDAMQGYARQMGAFAKNLEHMEGMQRSLDRNSKAGGEVIAMVEKVMPEIKAASQVVALLCSTLLQANSRAATQPSPAGQPADVVAAAERAQVIITDGPPPPDAGAFYSLSEEQAAENEAMQKAKDAGYPSEEHSVPKEQMNDAGSV